MSLASRQIAIVEEDETLREAIARAVRLEAHRVTTYGDGDAASEAFARVAPDAAVVSLTIPGVGGPELCRRLRERTKAIPLIASVPTDEALDTPGAVAAGADDYLVKPFTIKDLMPRLTALIRRAGLKEHEPLTLEERPITLGALMIDPLRLRATWNNTDLGVTVTEFFVLLSLARRAGMVKTRDQLLREAFPGRSTSSAEGVIERVLTRLRRRFAEAEPGLDPLETVPGAGFRYRAARRT